MKMMNFPENIRALVCSDFDETYFAHDKKSNKSVSALDDYLKETQDILFGVVSANTLHAIEQNLDAEDFKYYPHFIACNSGAELYFFKEGEITYDKDYEKSIIPADFTKEAILDMEDILNHEGIHLIIQQPFINERFSRNYYYKETDQAVDEKRFERIRALAAERHFSVNISKTNPLVGDPAGHYDIDIYPEKAGKAAVAKYLISKYQIPFESTFAFGDSGNDIKMLETVKHGYLVSNATDDAKAAFTRVASAAYTKGILETIQKIRRESNEDHAT